MKYITEKKTGHAFGSNGIRDSVRAVVLFDEDGKLAYSGPSYWADNAPRNMMAHAGKMAKRFQHYYETTGKRWEVEQEEKHKAARAAEKAEKEGKQAVRDAAPDLLEALRIARPAVAHAVKAGKASELVLKTIDTAMTKAQPKENTK